MKNGRKIVIWILGLLAGLSLLLAVLYALPIHKHMDVTMYDDAGTPSDMQMDLTVSRSVISLLKPKIQGTIVFEGRQYQSISYYEKQHAYYFIDTEHLDEGGTIIDLIQNALYFPFIDYHSVPSDSSGSTDDYLLMLQTRDGKGKTWRSYMQDN